MRIYDIKNACWLSELPFEVSSFDLIKTLPSTPMIVHGDKYIEFNNEPLPEEISATEQHFKV